MQARDGGGKEGRKEEKKEEHVGCGCAGGRDAARWESKRGLIIVLGRAVGGMEGGF